MSTQAIETLERAVAALPPQWQNLDMQDVLIPAVNALPDLLAQKDIWKSVYIDYEQPYLMRLFTECRQPSIREAGKLNKIRLNAHYFFGRTKEETDPFSGLPNPYAANKKEVTRQQDAELYHYHNWAAGFFLLDGGYDQQIGYATQPGRGVIPPVTERRTHHAEDAATNAFAFNDPYLWHRVIPQDNKPVSTMMVTYIPDNWNQPVPVVPALRRLKENETDFMLGHFTQQLKRLNPLCL